MWMIKAYFCPEVMPKQYLVLVPVQKGQEWRRGATNLPVSSGVALIIEIV